MLSLELTSNGDYMGAYRGLYIKAVQDQDCANPWEDSDGFAPMLWTSGDSVQDQSGRYDIESPLHRLSDRKIREQWRPLCQALDVDSAEAERDCSESRSAYGGSIADVRRDYLENRLAEMLPSGGRQWSAACDYFAALESLWELAGVAALDFQRNGYSQGDSIRGLLVALPEWRKAMGIKPSAQLGADLKAQADTFAAWAFGDCYGFEIVTPDGESLDSCWGFVGSDFEQSGLAEAAKEAADSIIAAAAQRKAERLKELVRNRVPFNIRPAALAEAGNMESAI